MARTEITLGDLHANALKLLYFLIREGVVSCEKACYDQFIKIYTLHTAGINIKTLDAFDRLLQQLKYIPHSPKVRLLGDELFDRGSNDYFVLKILDKIIDLGVSVEIILSNHGLEFLYKTETDDIFIGKKQTLYLQDDYSQTPSFHNMLTLLNQLDKKNIEKTLSNIIYNSYLSCIKLLSYTQNTENNHITLYTHAPVELYVIEKIAARLNSQYDDSTVATLAKTIDKINSQFSQYVLQKQISQLFNDKRHNPFIPLIWQRYGRQGYEYAEFLPAGDYKGYTVHFVHGHDGSGTMSTTVTTDLDNMLGKGNNMTGVYTVYQCF